MKAGQLMKSPRHLLRDISRNVFYKGPGDWTADVEHAMSFSDMQELIATCERCEIRDAEVVEHFPGGHLDFHVPVSQGAEFLPGK